MQKNKGITLVALILTIVILMMLAGVGITVTSHMQEQMKLQAFKTKLDTLQTEVIQKYAEQKNFPDEDADVDVDAEGFTHYNAEKLIEMGFTNTEQDAYINWNTRQVQMEYKGQRYTSEKYNVQSNITNEINTDFDLKLEYKDNRYKVAVEPKENKAGLEVSYRVKAEEGQEENSWIISNELEFEYAKYGIYEVKLKDKNGQETIKTINNTNFYVQDGLMLHYDGINNNGDGHKENVTTWKDLSGNNKDGTLNGGAVWAEDGLEFDGTDDWVSIDQMNYDNITIEAVVLFNENSTR